MITCKGDEADITKATQCGVIDYFVKPFPIRELGDRIRYLLKGHHA